MPRLPAACVSEWVYTQTQRARACIIVCKGLCLMPRWLWCFCVYVCVHMCVCVRACMPKQITCLNRRAFGGVLAWGVVYGWPPPQHPSQSLSQQEQLLPWGPPSLFQAAAAFLQINPSAPSSHFPAGGPWARWGGVWGRQCPQQAS